MERFTGIIGILVLLALAYLMSNNRKSINYRQVLSGLLIQVIVAVFILKVPIGQQIFQVFNLFLVFRVSGQVIVREESSLIVSSSTHDSGI